MISSVSLPHRAYQTCHYLTRRARKIQLRSAPSARKKQLGTKKPAPKRDGLSRFISKQSEEVELISIIKDELPTIAKAKVRLKQDRLIKGNRAEVCGSLAKCPAEDRCVDKGIC